jgi:hypothetical protein
MCGGGGVQLGTCVGVVCGGAASGRAGFCDEYIPTTIHCMTLYRYSLLIPISAFPSEGRTTWVRRYSNVSKGSHAYRTTSTSRYLHVRTVNLTSQMTRQARFPMHHEPRRDSQC